MSHWKEQAKATFKALRSPETLVEIPVPEVMPLQVHAVE